MLFEKGGRPLTMTVGASTANTAGVLSSADLSSLQAEIGASNDTMHKIMKTIRGRIGKNAIEPGANAQIVEEGKKLDSFFRVKKIPMEVSKSILFLAILS